MKYAIANQYPSTRKSASVLLVGAFEDDFETPTTSSLSSGVVRAVASTKNAIMRQAKAEEFSGKTGQVVRHFAGGKPAQDVVLLGLGKRAKFGTASLKKALISAFKKARSLEATRVSFDVSALLPGSADGFAGVSAFEAGELIGAYAGLIDYEINHQKTKKSLKKAQSHFDSLTLVACDADDAARAELERGVASGITIAKSVNHARDLTNLPAEDLTPLKFADRAQAVADASNGLITARFYHKRDLEQMGAGAILGVARGSYEPPVLMELDYTPASGATKEVLCFVGKSITFDSGGLDLKPADGMRHMKRDMAGGAATLSAIEAIAALGLPISIKVVMAATENMPSGRSYRPGDVLKTLAGITVEVDNTDAEGRLTLADAIEFAKRKGVSRIVDLATLTGAVKMIAGDVGAAAFSNNDDWAKEVVAAGSAWDERMVHMPMWDELRDRNHTDIADLKNSGGPLAGSTTAAWFIREFAGEDIPWVHLDIAGSAFRDREIGADPRGSTGYGVRTLVELARRVAGKQQ